MAARIGPVGFDALTTENRFGDIALRRLGQAAVERLKDEAQAGRARIGRMKARREIAGSGNGAELT